MNNTGLTEVELIRTVCSYLLRAQFYKAHYLESGNPINKSDSIEMLKFAKRFNDKLPDDNKITVASDFETLKVDVIWPKN